jgi:CheY-like chemotaxis protein
MSAIDPQLLVVDDDYELRSSLKELLEIEGYQVREAANGLEALGCLDGAGFRPCVILLDLRMPCMNGFQFYAELQRHPEWSSIPILIISAAQESELHKIPAKGVLQKPFDPDSLFSELSKLCAPAGPCSLA